LLNYWDKMNYPTFIFLHTYGRWVLLIIILLTIFRSAFAWYKSLPYNRLDLYLLKTLVIVAQWQLVLGTLVYTFSPLVSFLNRKDYHFSTEFDFLFFAVIHPLVMLVCVFILSMSPIKISLLADERKKHKSTVILLSVIIIVIILFIPWPFWERIARPLYR